MEYVDTNLKLNNILKNGKFNEDQIEVIKYAIRREDVDESVVLNSNIPANYMRMYVNLAGEGIDVETYINNEWHNKGYDEKSLANIIRAHNQFPGFIEQFPDLKFDKSKNINKKELLNSLDPLVKKFLKLQSEFHDIDGFLRPEIVDMPLNKVAYLFYLYDRGYEIGRIFNNEYSLDEMKKLFEEQKNMENGRKK